MLMPDHFLKVSQVVRRIKEDLEEDTKLQRIWVKGEVSNYKKAFSGHLYFTLKDDKASLRCVMFSSAAKRLVFDMEDGMDVLVQGRISVFEASGSVQLYANNVLALGQGQLFVAFNQLKESLKKEGLFDRKKEIPVLPSRIGIVTSRTGSVLHDMAQVALRRNPLTRLILAKASVQGKEASGQIVQAIDRLNRYGQVDVIIVGRGGGSLEDLWPFNTEEVARAIDASKLPVVSAVGHETDTTISDMVADLRAPTPSAAAELLVDDVFTRLEGLEGRLFRVLGQLRADLMEKERRLARLEDREGPPSILSFLDRLRERTDYQYGRASAAIRKNLGQDKETLARLEGRLMGLNPLSALKRGYVIARQADRYVQTISQIDESQDLWLTLADGQVRTQVREVKKDEK